MPLLTILQPLHIIRFILFLTKIWYWIYQEVLALMLPKVKQKNLSKFSKKHKLSYLADKYHLGVICLWKHRISYNENYCEKLCSNIT